MREQLPLAVRQAQHDAHALAGAVGHQPAAGPGQHQGAAGEVPERQFRGRRRFRCCRPSRWAAGVALTIVGNAVLDPGGTVLPAARLEAGRRAGPRTGAAASPRRRGLVHHGSRPGAGAVPARAVAGDGDHGRFLQHRPGAVRAGPGVPIGVFTGLAMFVPYVGFGIGLVLAVVAGMLQFASIKALVMVAVVYGAGQVIEGFYLTPRLVGERIGLHPAGRDLRAARIRPAVRISSACWWRCRPAPCCWWPSAACATATWAASCTSSDRSR